MVDFLAPAGLRGSFEFPVLVREGLRIFFFIALLYALSRAPIRAAMPTNAGRAPATPAIDEGRPGHCARMDFKVRRCCTLARASAISPLPIIRIPTVRGPNTGGVTFF